MTVFWEVLGAAWVVVALWAAAVMCGIW